MSSDIQIWFLRHGKPLSNGEMPFDYKTRNYNDFIQMLCNGYSVPLDEYPEIDFKSLPEKVDFVGYSPIKRARQTAEVLGNKLIVESMGELEFLREVQFDPDIVKEYEFESLPESREVILERWYNGKNKTETFEASKARVKKIESFLSELQVNTVILITHGWFLRLLENYFVQGKPLEDISLKDIIKVEPVKLGHCIKATVVRKYHVELQENSSDDDILSKSNSPVNSHSPNNPRFYQRWGAASDLRVVPNAIRVN